MDRRSFLRAGAAAGLATVAGCTDWYETQSIWAGGPLVEDRPDAVYLPGAEEGMGTFGTLDLSDGTRLSLHYTYPHRFWTVTGESRTLAEVQEGQGLHLMTSVWDPETGTVLPRSPRATILRDGAAVEDGRLWPMLAQRMGYHFGDNVSLPGDGQYEVAVQVDPLAVRGLGAFERRFDAASAAETTVDFESDDVLALPIDRLPRERRGERDALAPMEGHAPPGRAPLVEELPGTTLFSGRSGDAVVAATLLETPPAGAGTSGPYLAVSPRTPHNRLSLPGCSLAASVAGGGEHDLVESLEERLGIHYGVVLDDRPSDRVTVRVDAPPQVARHDGYETAFFDMPDAELSVASAE